MDSQPVPALPVLKTTGEASPAQRKAIEHASGPMQVLAGPGSGKTFLMIRRIRHLICHHGVSPDKILVITFAKAAALEMQERFHKLTHGDYRSVSFGTFHAIYYHILKSSNGKGNLIPISSKEKIQYLKHSLAMYGIEDADSDMIDKLFQEISKAKNREDSGLQEYSDGKNDGDAEGAQEEPVRKYFPGIFREYCRIMEENQKLDFDDMILLCNKMLAKNKSLLAYWQERFSHILVDEFQDIGPLQYRILQKLAAPENNLFVVGDDDQSIYGFRGAGPNIMKQFIHDYKGAAQVFLDINYRCTEKIVKAASLLIADNQNRFVKCLRAEKTGGEEVKLHFFLSLEEETDYLINEFRQMTEDELKETAVIYRTNALAGNLTRFLVKYGIPFQIYGKAENLWEHPVAKDLLSYLQFAKDISRFSGQGGKRGDFLRIMNRPCRFFHREAARNHYVTEENLLEYYQDLPYMQQRLRDFLAGLKHAAAFRPYLATDYIRKRLEYDSYLYGKKEGQRTWMEIADYIQETQQGFLSFDEWKASMDASSTQMKAADTKKERKGISFITMHSAKGLEYDHVFLPDINEKIVPHKKAISPEQIEEERRLLYVAMTRAKKRLEILSSSRPSFFLEKLVSSLPSIRP